MELSSHYLGVTQHVMMLMGVPARFILLAPKDKDHYNPIMDLEKSLYTIVERAFLLSLCGTAQLLIVCSQTTLHPSSKHYLAQYLTRAFRIISLHLHLRRPLLHALNRPFPVSHPP